MPLPVPVNFQVLVQLPVSVNIGMLVPVSEDYRKMVSVSVPVPVFDPAKYVPLLIFIIAFRSRVFVAL